MEELIELTARPDAGSSSYDRAPQPADLRPRANLLGVPVDAVDIEGAISVISSHLGSGDKGYVCAVGVHGILEALRKPVVADAFAASRLNVPDGTPTVWIGRLQGFRTIDHVTGPTLMREIFRRPEFSEYSHFFYGGKPGVADELASTVLRQFPWVRIAGTYTPPFTELSADQEQQIATAINACRPDIIWVGISTPRQELWMRHMLSHVHARLLFGVGAAFDFHTGHIRECPSWIKRAGFNWLHRLVQDPKRLWRRNVQNTAFLWHIAMQLTGAREYPLRIRFGQEPDGSSARDDESVESELA
jgi:N-acetylglucosaminyldiphosphoundecaprenol N-acetyl-beta-D-mannosaminyltransferase